MDSLSDRQLQDEIIRDFVDVELPADDRKARELLLSQSEFTVLDGVLYWIERDKTLKIIPPTRDRH